jgi:hypothetical protein
MDYYTDYWTFTGFYGFFTGLVAFLRVFWVCPLPLLLPLATLSFACTLSYSFYCLDYHAL